MGGGLMQLVAYGAQDIYLTGNPQITFFKVVYRRHTNFSVECIQQTFNGQWTAGISNVTATISRNGDLISNMHLDVLLPTSAASALNAAGAAITNGNQVPNTAYANWCRNTGHALIDTVELEIGGQMIDKHYGHWLDVWRELTDHDGKEDSMVNVQRTNGYFTTPLADRGGANPAYGGVLANGNVQLPSLQLYIPLKFWFNRNPGLALPLIALQYHEVKLKIRSRALNTLINAGGLPAANVPRPGIINPIVPGNPTRANLWVDYIYLDTDERRRFAQQSHEYLIEQLQFERNGLAVGANTVRLNLNHPVKELIWTVQANAVFAATAHAANVACDAVFNDYRTNPLVGFVYNQANLVAAGGPRPVQPNDYFNYSTHEGVALTNVEVIQGQVSPEGFNTAQLKLNGHDRFAARKASYFRTITPVQAGHRLPQKKVYVYSFALKPEEHQPSGTCNFSRIDNAQLALTNCPGAANAGCSVNVYAINYNVLRIMSGMGGLAYSN
jgi:hypothetical protein